MNNEKTQVLLNLEQEKRLITDAYNKGDFSGIVVYYATKREFKKIEEISKKIPDDDLAGKMYLALLDSDRDKAIKNSYDLVLSQNEYWPYYSYIKLLISAKKFKEAISAAKNAIFKNTANSPLLNLIGKGLLYFGSKTTAIEVFESSLALNPRQEDISELIKKIKEGSDINIDLYLDSKPKYEIIDFYIPVYNVEKYIRTAIEGLITQDYPINNIYVVNDGTRDNSISIAKEYPVVILDHGQNKGLAAARNTAFKASDAKFVGAIDTDAVPDRGFIRNIMAEFENSGTQLKGAGGRMDEKYISSRADLWRSKRMAQNKGEHRILNVDFLFGSNCIFKKISVIDAGGFNERFRSNYEDVDICKRIKASGGDLVYLPWAKVLHLRTDTDLSVLKTKWNWNFWHYYELGAYKDIKVLAAKIIQQTQICVANVNDALSNGENGVAMLDIFNIIYTCLLDMDYAEKNELCSQSVALGFRNELLSNFKMLDKKFGGSLFDEFIKITGLNSITEFSENSNVTGSLRYALDAVIGIFNSINRNIYIALCSGIKEAAIA